MLEALAYQDDFIASCDVRLKQLHAINFEIGLQLVLEVFFAQQIEPVAADSPKHGMNDPGGEDAVHGIKKRPQHSHYQYQPTPYPALQKRLRIPGEKGYGTYGR